MLEDKLNEKKRELQKAGQQLHSNAFDDKDVKSFGHKAEHLLKYHRGWYLYLNERGENVSPAIDSVTDIQRCVMSAQIKYKMWNLIIDINNPYDSEYDQKSLQLFKSMIDDESTAKEERKVTIPPRQVRITEVRSVLATAAYLSEFDKNSNGYDYFYSYLK